MTVVNLNRARKVREKAEKVATAAENRAKFGRSKADKSIDKARAALKDAKLDGHKLD